ncbi:hypothetical protein BF49_4927 [Bradyrhizobium sp.]|nr:hypothetical protein BF49_4927 [Bradyrhizobium sp.]
MISSHTKFSPAFSTSSLLCMGLFSRFLVLPPQSTASAGNPLHLPRVLSP